MSMAAPSPMRGTRRAAGGSSEYSTVASTCAPAPALNSISVAPGVRLTMRSGGAGTCSRWPRSSLTTRSGPPAPAAAAAAPSAAHTNSQRARRRMIGGIMRQRAAPRQAPLAPGRAPLAAARGLP